MDLNELMEINLSKLSVEELTAKLNELKKHKVGKQPTKTQSSGKTVKVKSNKDKGVEDAIKKMTPEQLAKLKELLG